MITLTFPDGASRQADAGVSARDVAAGISKSLEKKAVAAIVNGTLVDLADPITTDSALRIVTRDDPEALELIRHDCAQQCATNGLFSAVKPVPTIFVATVPAAAPAIPIDAASTATAIPSRTAATISLWCLLLQCTPV